jgi:acyl transferase domain-containing protein
VKDTDCGEPPRRLRRGALVLGAANESELLTALSSAAGPAAFSSEPPDPAILAAPVRLAIDYGDTAELAAKAGLATTALRSGRPAMWRALTARGVFLGRGPAAKTAFLYPGQGSQYVNMLADLRANEPVVADTFAEVDRIMTPRLGKPLTDALFADPRDVAAVDRLDRGLLRNEITQPAVIAADLALTRLIAAYGIEPDLIMGHSLGEYGALVAAGCLSMRDAIAAALTAVEVRGRDMAAQCGDDPGAMAAVFAPMPEIERIVAASRGYVAVANINSTSQAVLGGATAAVEVAMAAFTADGYTAIRLPVSHAFHTPTDAVAGAALKQALADLRVGSPRVPIVANLDGRFYPNDGRQVLDILCRQLDSPVQFVRGLHTLYEAGARVFVELGPGKTLHSFAADVFAPVQDSVSVLFTNSPRVLDAVALHQAVCGLYAAGLGGRDSSAAGSAGAEG